MKHKIMQVMMEREESTILSGRIEVDDADVGGERHEGKRGRGAPGKTPFVVAVMTDPDNPASVLHMRMKALRHVDTKVLRKWLNEGCVRSRRRIAPAA